MGQAKLKMTCRTLRIFGTVYFVIVFVERGVVILAFSEFACGCGEPAWPNSAPL